MISIILFTAAFISLALFLLSLKNNSKKEEPIIVQKVQQPVKKTHGRLQVFYGSQTGTAAKMAQTFGQEAIQKGWQAEVIDLKDIKYKHFSTQGEISVFFLSNTGDGDPPVNAVKFFEVLRKKADIDEINIIDWTKIGFTVFGLGSTQYEHFNKTGKDADALLQTRGAHRVYKLGLGDSNASLEDDLIEWKQDLWDALVQYRNQHPLAQRIQQPHEEKHASVTKQTIVRKYLTNSTPEIANFRFYICSKEADKMDYTEDDLDFKTKASLKSTSSNVTSIRQVRQNTKDGSTLELQIALENSPHYDTAGNIALYPKNDPNIVSAIVKYFNFSQQQLESYISVQKIHQDKKLKLNFVPYCRLIDLLESHIDLQGRLTKSVLKKLSKYPSNDKEYFVTNSSPKTTAEFKRITEETDNVNGWYYLFRIIQQKQVQIGFQDFIELSDSIAPRVFTIGSCYKKQKNVVVMASIIENGLISKFFNAQPGQIRAELKKSSFNDAMKWKKVIFISVGTGFAPFRGYLQEKQLLMERAKNGQQVSYPRVTLFFGCKRSNGDFIYKQEIENWVEKQVINVLHGAFSRQQQEVKFRLIQKIYVQHLLQKQEQEIKEYLQEQNSAIYICGSLGMGHEVSKVLAQRAGGEEKIKELEHKGRIVKELW